MSFKTGIILLLGLTLVAAEFRDASVNASRPRSCYSCSGINCQRTTRQNATVACNDLLDVCVTVFEDFRVTERGCLLELSQAGQTKCNAKDKECLKCSGELCNNQGRSDFQCIQCSGSETSKCNSDATSLSAAQCGAPTSNNAYCYVKVDGKNLQRGCALSVSEQQSCLKDAECSLCLPDTSDSGACNTYDLSYKSGAARGQQFYGLLLTVLSLLALRVSQ